VLGHVHRHAKYSAQVDPPGIEPLSVGESAAVERAAACQPLARRAGQRGAAGTARCSSEGCPPEPAQSAPPPTGTRSRRRRSRTRTCCTSCSSRPASCRRVGASSTRRCDAGRAGLKPAGLKRRRSPRWAFRTPGRPRRRAARPQCPSSTPARQCSRRAWRCGIHH
jgi:hypothetical protein